MLIVDNVIVIDNYSLVIVYFFHSKIKHVLWKRLGCSTFIL